MEEEDASKEAILEAMVVVEVVQADKAVEM